jgi:hypothetical protein
VDSRNPVEEYLTKKTAGFGQAFGDTLKSGLNPSALGEHAAKGLVGAGMAAAGAGTVALGVHGAQKLYDAATKARDFRAMLGANANLAQRHAEDPRLVNQMFSTLRTFNPQFTRDPIVAAQYVSSMVEDPVHAGSMATEALNFREKLKNPLTENVTRAAFHRAEKGK